MRAPTHSLLPPSFAVPKNRSPLSFTVLCPEYPLIFSNATSPVLSEVGDDGNMVVMDIGHEKSRQKSRKVSFDGMGESSSDESLDSGDDGDGNEESSITDQSKKTKRRTKSESEGWFLARRKQEDFDPLYAYLNENWIEDHYDPESFYPIV